MSEGNSIKDWIKVAKLAKEAKREHFFGVFIQAGVDDGSFFVVVFNKMDKVPIKGGIPATRKEIETLRELGITIDDKEDWLGAWVKL